MAWVIGASSLFGYGVMLSDVRVRFPNGKTADLVRKAFPVGPYIAAGFAGSVYIGFRLLESLQKCLFIPPSTPDIDQLAWRPEWVAEQWGPEAKAVYASCPKSELQLGAQFLMVGVSPTEDIGSPEFRRVYIVRFSARTSCLGICASALPWLTSVVTEASNHISRRSGSTFG